MVFSSTSKLIWLSVLLFLTQFVFSKEVFYELKEDESCSGVGVQSQHVDILCVIPNPSEICSDLAEAKVTWLFSSRTDRHSVKESDKYSIWEEKDFHEMTSLVRVNNVDEDTDKGMFTCSLQCDSTSQSALSRKMELCVQDGATGLISCSLSTTEDSCTLTFGDGKCDEKCDSEEQLFDGDDCDSYAQETCSTGDCLTRYNDNQCSLNCSSSQCGFDGGDCLASTQSITRETLAVVVPSVYTPVQIEHLSMQLSISLSTLVELHGNATPWTANNNQNIKVTYTSPEVFQQTNNQLVILEYKLVPQSCPSGRNCFLRVKNAAKYISHHLTYNNRYINSSVAVVGINSIVDNCYVRKEVKSPNSRFKNTKYTNTGVNPDSERTTSNTKNKKKLEVGGIVGIAMGGLAILLLITGIVVACRYRTIALSREKSQTINKQSQVKQYIESIPTDLSSDGSSSNSCLKSPHSSINRSVTSKDTILPRSVSRTQHYKFEEDA